MKGQREDYIDVAKGLGMLFVICRHTEVFPLIGMSWTFVAVPLFFLMSGFFERSDKPIGEYVRKAFMTLVIPGVIWVLLATGYVKLLGFVKSGSFCENPFTWYSIGGLNSAAWFLFALFYAKILLHFLLGLRLPKIIIGGAVISLGYWGMNVELPLFLDEGLAALPLYWAGKELYPYLKKLLAKRWLMVVGVLAICIYMLDRVSFVIVPSAKGTYSPYYLLSFAGVVLTCLPILYLSMKLVRKSWLRQIGLHSLGVMLLHSPMCHTCAVILNRVFDKGSVMWICSSLVAYILIVFMAYQLTILIEKYCPMLLGKSKRTKVC